MEKELEKIVTSDLGEVGMGQFNATSANLREESKEMIAESGVIKSSTVDDFKKKDIDKNLAQDVDSRNLADETKQLNDNPAEPLQAIAEHIGLKKKKKLA